MIQFLSCQVVNTKSTVSAFQSLNANLTL